MRRAAPPSCTVTWEQTTGQGWRLAVPGRDVMIRDWYGEAEYRHRIDRSPADQHPIDRDSEGGLRSRAVYMKDPRPDRTARSELDDLRASAVKIGTARLGEYSALWVVYPSAYVSLVTVRQSRPGRRGS